VLLSVFTLPLGTCYAISVITIAGQQVEVKEFQLDETGLEARTADGVQQFAIAKLLSVTLDENAGESLLAPGMAVATTDGAVLSVHDFQAAKGSALVRPPFANAPLEISTKHLRYVRLAPLSKSVEPFWRELLAETASEDLLVVQKKTGPLDEAVWDSLGGIVQEVGEQRVEFNWDVDVVPVKRSKVAAIVYYHPKAPQPPAAVCVVHLRDGSQIPCQSLRVTSSDPQVTLETPLGLSLSLPLREILTLDFSAGKLLYLSDLEPLAMKWTPLIGFSGRSEYLQRQGEPRFNQAFTGSSLQLVKAGSRKREVQTYKKGIALRSRTEMVFEIPEGMKRFETLAGINPETASQGNVLLEFSSRGRLLWEDKIDGQEAPASVAFPLAGVRRLRILVDYGENLDYGDQLHLVNPRVSK